MQSGPEVFRSMAKGEGDTFTYAAPAGWRLVGVRPRASPRGVIVSVRVVDTAGTPSAELLHEPIGWTPGDPLPPLRAFPNVGGCQIVAIGEQIEAMDVCLGPGEPKPIDALQQPEVLGLLAHVTICGRCGEDGLCPEGRALSLPAARVLGSVVAPFVTRYLAREAGESSE